MILADHSFGHTITEWWPVVVCLLGLIVYAVRLDAKVSRHQEVLTEVHDKLDDQAKHLAEVKGNLRALLGIFGNVRPGGRRWTDEYGRTHDDGGG